MWFAETVRWREHAVRVTPLCTLYRSIDSIFLVWNIVPYKRYAWLKRSGMMAVGGKDCTFLPLPVDARQFPGVKPTSGWRQCYVYGLSLSILPFRGSLVVFAPSGAQLSLHDIVDTSMKSRTVLRSRAVARRLRARPCRQRSHTIHHASAIIGTPPGCGKQLRFIRLSIA